MGPLEIFREMRLRKRETADGGVVVSDGGSEDETATTGAWTGGVGTGVEAGEIAGVGIFFVGVISTLGRAASMESFFAAGTTTGDDER